MAKIEGIHSGQRQYTLTVTGTNWTTGKAVGIPYKTLEGVWRLRFNIHGTFSVAVTAGAVTVGLGGVTFGSGNHAVAASHSDGADLPVKGLITGNGSNITFYVSAARTVFQASGDVELSGKPSWAE